MAATTLREMHVPEKISPIRHDPAGSITEVPSPTKMHHLHILSGDNYDAMVTFYQRLFNAEIVRVADEGPVHLTFLSYDDHDHRIVIIKIPGGGVKSDNPIGVSHLAFGYSSLGEVLYLYKRMKEWGYPAPHWVVNHGNSTSIYYKDPDGNEVETMVDNYTPQEAQDYKRYYQFSEEFGKMSEADFDPDKMVALYEAGTPDSILMDREEVRIMVRDGKL